MGRKKKNKQAFHFPTEEPEKVAGFETPVDLTEDAEKKKQIKKAADSVPEIFQPEQVEFVFDVYAAILSFIYSVVLKTDIKPILEELKFEDTEKQAMSKPLARIASKYAPSEWAGMQAEIELITSLGLWTVMSFRRASTVAESEKAKKKETARPVNVAPRPRMEPQAIPVG